uniref:Small ribosomal subunit protein uS14c n=1 Tax=Mesotaenium endlicherianum TaxID=184485 RepID=A0A024B4A8_9VIRI|nr:ribosomal protein S14 [Mesotaenium endlicherianum]AHZ11192.1 ribosomal protein S14 [Mesotaenium endlicherianum]
MAKKSSIERNKKRQKLAHAFQHRRTELKQLLSKTLSAEEKLILHRRMQSLPRNSAPTRIHRRCLVSGRPQAVYRDFALSRHIVREMAHACLLPGVTKSSW